MQSTDMIIVTKLESVININEPQPMDSEVFSEHQIGVNLHYFGVNR